MLSTIKTLSKRLSIASSLTLFVALLIAPHSFAAGCPTPSPSYGEDTMSVSVPVGSTYNVWVRTFSTKASSTAILLQVDAATCFNVGASASLPTNTWNWVNYQNGTASQVMRVSIATGTHTLTLLASQPNMEVDSILLLSDLSCLPTGTGTNCTTGQSSSTSTTTTSTTTTTTTSGGSHSTTKAKVYATSTVPTISGLPSDATNGVINLTKSVVIGPTYTPGQTIHEVQYFINNKLVYTATKPPYSYHLNTNNFLRGTYKLETKTIYTSGKIADVKALIKINHSFLGNTLIFIKNNIVILLVVLLIIGGVLFAWIRYRKTLLHPPTHNPPAPINQEPVIPAPHEPPVDPPTSGVVTG